MTPEAFAELAELVPDGLLLVSADGAIVAANRHATAILGGSAYDRIDGVSLDRLASNAPEDIAGFLRFCRRSQQEVVGSLLLNGNTSPTRLFGRVFSRGGPSGDSTVLLRIPDEDETVNRFTVLNQKIEELGQEIGRRRQLEGELREQARLAAFGRDIGLALAEEAGLRDTLGRCAQLIVERFDAAFARIWTIAPNREDLELQASAGIYTHLDGPHSRIRVGQYKIGLIAAEQKPHLTNSVIGDDRVHDQDWAKKEGMVAFAGYPLIVDGRTVGVMAMFSRQSISGVSLAAMASVANMVALGIERKRVESELHRNAEALRLADQRKDEFLAMLAHELRNPLAPIRSGLELLQLETSDCETLSLMSDQVQHLTRLVDDLLDVSRIMRGRIELRLTALCLDEVINHAVRTVQSAIDRHGHKLTVRHCSDPIWLNADRVRLGQIITNLLTNAAKYTPDGGELQIQSTRDENHATLRVRDNGVGIDAHFLPEVFELFAQAERGLARSEGGLGIGLTLVRRLVELHGGEIHVISEGSDKGSEFVVRLPLSDPPAGEICDHPQATFRLPPDCRILVVDDSVGSAKILRRLLTAIGASKIEIAHDGPSAIIAAEEFLPDVIFLDIGLPGLTGLEVAERLRSDDRFETTKLVALTGYGTADDRRKSRDVGFDDHLVKPVSLEELKHVLTTG